MRPILLLPLSFFFHLTTAALQNVTLDDTDPSITYSPRSAWESGLRSSLNSNGSHSLGTGPNATATITFTGVAIYYLASLWPFEIGTVVALDDTAIEFVNLTDPNSATTSISASESAPAAVRWSKTGLQNTTHRLILGAPGPALMSNTFVISDGFIYTIDDGLPNPSASVSSSIDSSSIDMNAVMTSLSTAADYSPTQITTLSSPSPSSSAAAGTIKVLALGLGAGLGASALIAGFFFFFFFHWRRKRNAGGGKQMRSNVRDSWGKTQDVTPFILPPTPPPVSTRGSRSRMSALAAAQSPHGGDSEAYGLLAAAADDDEDDSDSGLASSSTVTQPLAVRKKKANARTYGLGEKGVPLREEEEFVVPPPAYSEDV
ncbi:hypothetical protein FB45DRAFT_899337 [Roridomyces roridus]|uniref:Mid2 domain-containing protein n=1 Tax=Roridomyces roridus TaxID=1738132 RepID=A0AAD7FVV2_9AGAR|nr:hypothetical protein FB45DRAFT_899337 [Roridomyces roridus]